MHRGNKNRERHQHLHRTARNMYRYHRRQRQRDRMPHREAVTIPSIRSRLSRTLAAPPQPEPDTSSGAPNSNTNKNSPSLRNMPHAQMEKARELNTLQPGANILYTTLHPHPPSARNPTHVCGEKPGGATRESKGSANYGSGCLCTEGRVFPRTNTNSLPLRSARLRTQ